jgi:hypothetical protein
MSSLAEAWLGSFCLAIQARTTLGPMPGKSERHLLNSPRAFAMGKSVTWLDGVLLTIQLYPQQEGLVKSLLKQHPACALPL